MKGSLVRRCTKKGCRAIVRERRCGRCSGDSFRWYYIVDSHTSGERRRKWSKGFASKDEAERALREHLGLRDVGIEIEAAGATIGSCFDSWFPAASVARNMRPATADSYRREFNRYVRPRIGHVDLDEMTPAHLNALYGEVMSRGGREERRVSPNTVRHVHVLLHLMFDSAVKTGAMLRNVADVAEPPRQRRLASDELGVWSGEQMAGFLGAVREDRLYALWRLMVVTGCRRGEACGVRWTDLDLSSGVWSLRRSLGVLNGSRSWGEPKTSRGRRTIALDEATVATLRAHKAAQGREKMKARDIYQDSGLVFCHEDGTPLHPNVVSRWFGRHADKAGLPSIRLHDVRHSAITAMLEAGIPVKVVSERVGHASTAFTMDVYASVLPNMQADAARAIASVLDG